MRESLCVRGGAVARSAAPCAPHCAPHRLLVHHLPARTVIIADGLRINPTPKFGLRHSTVWVPARTLASHVAAAAAADDDGLVLPDPRPQPREGTRCYLQVLGKTTLRTSRIPISAAFAEQLVGQPVSLGTEVTLPVHLDGCRPRTNVPASCTIGLRLRDGRPVGRYVAGLGAFLRANGAAAESTLLLLTAVAPGPAAAARRLAVELINEQDVGPGVFAAMHDHVAVLGPWHGTPDGCNVKFLQGPQHHGQAARTLKPSAKALSNMPPAPCQQPPSMPSATAASALPPPPPQSPRPSRTTPMATDPDALVLVRKMRKTTLSATRITICAAFAKELAGGPVDTPGNKVTVPIHQPGSEPQAFLPAACHISVRSRVGGAVERVLHGLSAYIRSNGALADSTLLWLAAVPADPALGHDRPSLQVRLINGWDMEPAAFSALHSFIGRAGSWAGCYKHHAPFLAAEVQRVRTCAQASHVPAGAALPLLPRPPLPAAVAGPVQRSPKMERQQRVFSRQMLEQRLGMLPEGLDQVHVDAIRSYLQPAALQVKAVHLPQRALGDGVVSVHQAFATSCGATWQRGAKPDPVAAPLRHCYPPPTAGPLGHLVVRGSPRRRTDGCVDWAVTGLRAWLRGVGAAKGDLLLLWVVAEQRAEELEEGQGEQDGQDRAGSDGAVGLGMHLMRQEEVGLDVLQAVWAVVSGW